MKPLDQLTNMDELRKLLAKQRSGASRLIDAAEMASKLRERVKGQDHVIEDVVRLIKLNWAKEKRSRPIANLMFVGPTGTGKTELAKAMAEFLYGDEKAAIRFDCSEFTGPEAKNHLIGVPEGYKGADTGGKLTRPMLANKQRLVLFDEIEKSHTSVFDLFLQMMGEGRLTEQASGQTADFTQAIIVLTSNAEADVIDRLRRDISDHAEQTNAIKSHLVSTGKFRPEIMGRIDRICTFHPLDDETTCAIIALKMQVAAREFGLELVEVDPMLIYESFEKGQKLSKFGVREIDREITNTFGEHFLLAKEAGGKRVRLVVDDDGVPVIEGCEANV